MEMRAWVAAQRHMGFEMDPNELTPEEAATLTHVTSWWRTNRDWLLDADILRLDSADPSVLSEMHLSRDTSRFVVFANKIDTTRTILDRPIRLARLKPSRNYRINILNKQSFPALSRGNLTLKQKELNLPGRYLCHTGIQLPWNFPNRVAVIEGNII